jgi:hypothetical protein
MSEYNRLVLEASNQKRRAAEATQALQRVLAAVDQGLTLGDVDLAVKTIEDLNEHLRGCPPNMCRGLDTPHPEVRYCVGEECPVCQQAPVERVKDRDPSNAVIDRLLWEQEEDV